jgi:hypothetical protein
LSARLVWTDDSFARHRVVNTKCRTALWTSKRNSHLQIRKRKETGKKQKIIASPMIASSLRSKRPAREILLLYITSFFSWNTFDFPGNSDL